jgi:D-glycero-D-manno-heptose 1,7-bisphosphate phosphatase
MQIISDQISAILLDRDGVVNKPPKNGKYILEPKDLVLYEDAKQFVSKAIKSNKEVFIITNQQCVGLGLLTQSTLDEIHLKMKNELSAENQDSISKFYACTHKTTDNCHCRKPKIGLITQCINDNGLNREQIIFFGDNLSDMLCAETAKVKFIGVDRNFTSLFPYGIETIGNLNEVKFN